MPTPSETRGNAQTKKKAIVMMTFRVQAGIRTQDPILKRDVLYLLSYLNILRSWDCKNTTIIFTLSQKKEISEF